MSVEVQALLRHIQLHKAVMALLLILDTVKLVLVKSIDVSNILHPRVENLAKILFLHYRSDSSTVVVTCGKNVVNVEMLHSIGQDGK